METLVISLVTIAVIVMALVAIVELGVVKALLGKVCNKGGRR